MKHFLIAGIVVFGVCGFLHPEYVLASVETSATVTRDLHLGSKGSDVSVLQSYLEGQGFLQMPAGVAKGYFGKRTQEALARYQEMENITPAKGYFGPLTRARIAGSAIRSPVAISDAILQGTWVISLADPKDPECIHALANTVCGPNDSEMMDLEIENGVHTYNSYIHHDPEWSDCAWDMKESMVTIRCPGDNSFALHVHAITTDTLTTTRDGDGIPVRWKRFVSEENLKKEPVQDTSIRTIDLKKKLADIPYNNASKPGSEPCATYCGPNQKFINVTNASYGDINNDGKEDVAINAYSGLPGTSGTDINGAYTLSPSGALVELKRNDTYQGKSAFNDTWKSGVFEIKEQKLIESLLVYKDGDGNCCNSGGNRVIIYKWDGSQLVITDVKNILPGI